MEELKFGTVYKITSPTGRVYIGQTFDMNRRYQAYSKLRCKTQTRLYASLLKHGFDEHNIEVLYAAMTTPSNLISLEAEFISQFNSTGSNGLNVLSSGAEYQKRSSPRMPYVASEETRRKISEGNKGKVISPFQRMKMSINNPMRNPDNRRKMKEALSSPDVKRKMSDIQKRLKSINNPLNKAVIQSNIDGSFVAEHISASEAARVINTTNGRIADCCRGVRKTHKGFLWRYK
jgi:group I intron endonuclease